MNHAITVFDIFKYENKISYLSCMAPPALIARIAQFLHHHFKNHEYLSKKNIQEIMHGVVIQRGQVRFGSQCSSENINLNDIFGEYVLPSKEGVHSPKWEVLGKILMTMCITSFYMRHLNQMLFWKNTKQHILSVDIATQFPSVHWQNACWINHIYMKKSIGHIYEVPSEELCCAIWCTDKSSILSGLPPIIWKMISYEINSMHINTWISDASKKCL